jgi:hypothetical protein
MMGRNDCASARPARFVDEKQRDPGEQWIQFSMRFFVEIIASVKAAERDQQLQ